MKLNAFSCKKVEYGPGGSTNIWWFSLILKEKKEIVNSFFIKMSSNNSDVCLSWRNKVDKKLYDLNRNCTTAQTKNCKKGKKFVKLSDVRPLTYLVEGHQNYLATSKVKLDLATSRHPTARIRNSCTALLSSSQKIWDAISQEQNFSKLFRIFLWGWICLDLSIFLIFQKFCLDFLVKVFGFLCDFFGFLGKSF